MGKNKKRPSKPSRHVIPDAYSLASTRTRIAELKALGISDGVIKLCRRQKQEAFRFRCRPSYYIYHGGTIPIGPRIVPMWEEGTSQTVVRRSQDSLEFIHYSLEDPDEWEIVAYSEQGLLAYRFLPIVDAYLSDAEHDAREGDARAQQKALKALTRAADYVGFDMLQEVIDLRGRTSSLKKELEFTRSVS